MSSDGQTKNVSFTECLKISTADETSENKCSFRTFKERECFTQYDGTATAKQIEERKI